MGVEHKYCPFTPSFHTAMIIKMRVLSVLSCATLATIATSLSLRNGLPYTIYYTKNADTLEALGGICGFWNWYGPDQPRVVTCTLKSLSAGSTVTSDELDGFVIHEKTYYTFEGRRIPDNWTRIDRDVACTAVARLPVCNYV